MKIGIFLDNSDIVGVDLSRPDLGNPGIGGTEYCFLILAHSLKKYYPEIDVVVYCKKMAKLPAGISVFVVEDVIDAAKMSFSDGCDFILIRNQVSPDIYNNLEKIDQKFIIWGHNFYLSKEARLISKNKRIILNIFVGREQYDRYIDHNISLKSIYIYNMIPQVDSVLRSDDSKTVVYLGSLVEAKGFHILARQWKKIIKKYPRAKLKVIGSGALYNRNEKLGEFGISNPEYEKKFIKHLVDQTGQLLDSVKFMGIVGSDKGEIFSKASVGVINPSGKTETFGLGAIEMNQYCLPVVTIKKFGLLDTVINKKNGLTFLRSKNINKGILKLLKNKELNRDLGIRGREYSKFFDPEVLTKEWKEAFLIVLSNKKITYQSPIKNYFYGLKFLRIFTRFLRFDLNIKFLPAVIDIETFLYKIFKILRK